MYFCFFFKTAKQSQLLETLLEENEKLKTAKLVAGESGLVNIIVELLHLKTNNLHMPKQSR